MKLAMADKYWMLLVAILACTLEWSLVGASKLVYKSAAESNISSYCPGPSFWSNIERTCKCEGIGDVWKCTKMGQVAVLDGNCATFDKSKNVTEFGRCYYNSLVLGSTNYRYLPFNHSEWNTVTCGDFKRTGTLCGKCEGNYATYAYSFDLSCVECKNRKFNVFLYILAAFLPLTLFYIIVMLCNCNISSSPYRGFILFSQIIASPVHLRVAYTYRRRSLHLFQVVQLLGTVLGIWNLDFFRLYIHSICLQTDPLVTLALDLLVAVYPLILIVMTFIIFKVNYKPLACLWKAIRQLLNKNWNIRTSTVDSIATFLLLSNVKFLSISFDLLAPVLVTQVTTTRHTSTSWRLLYDATKEYFGPDHLPFAIFGIVANLLFVTTPTLILLFYPMLLFQKGLGYFPHRCQIYFNAFVDPFQGSFKDGTQPGTKDCRWFSAVPFLIQFVFLVLYNVTFDSSFSPYAAIVITVTILGTIVVDPYKPELHYLSYHFSMFLFFLASYFAIIASFAVQKNRYLLLVLTWLLLFSPFLYVSFLFLRWAINNSKFGQK